MIRTKRFILTGVIGVTASVAGLVFAATGFGSSTDLITTTALKSLVMSEASTAGDSSPTSVAYSALTTRNEANVVASGDTIGGVEGAATNYYLVVAHGNFTLTNAQIPPGAPNPTGTVMTLVVDAATGEVTDFGVQDTVPDMARLGPTTAIATN